MSRLALPVLVACACASPPQQPLSSAPELAPHVLVIGLDGVRPDQLPLADTPALDALAAAGARSLTGTNAWEPDRPWNGHSATNWGVLLTGVTPARNGATANGDEEHAIGVDNPAPGRVDSLFGLARGARPGTRTALFNTWGGIRDQEGTLLGRDGSSIDHWHHPRGDGSSEERDLETVAAALDHLTGAAPEVVFVHVDGADGAGHAHTYAGVEYRTAVTRTDALVGKLVAAVDARPTRADERWLVLVTSDHGGPADGTGHSDNSDPAVYTIPFVLRADGVAPGWDLGVPRLVDVTPTALDWLGVDLRPLGLDGRSLLPAR